MLDKLRNIFSGIKLSRRKNNKSDSSGNSESVGKLYGLWLLVLPLFMGAVLGRLTDVGLGYALDKFSGTQGRVDSAINFADKKQLLDIYYQLDEFLSTNPFHISPIKPVVAEAPKPKEEPKPQQKDTTMDNVILRGTLPGIGGWFEKDGKQTLVLVGKSLERYRLTSVLYNEAVFRRGRERVVKYIVYGPTQAKAKEEAPKPAPKPTPAPKPNPNDTGDVRAAGENQEGEVPAEMVQSLVQNPFDELKRIRMRPNDKAGGLEVQWIQNDSILKRLGVQRGDVIKSVNGIPFTNMGDIANSINSLMNSERFDVEVTRGGKSTALRYVVR